MKLRDIDWPYVGLSLVFIAFSVILLGLGVVIWRLALFGA